MLSSAQSAYMRSMDLSEACAQPRCVALPPEASLLRFADRPQGHNGAERAELKDARGKRSPQESI
jgi:hypothetical protein